MTTKTEPDFRTCPRCGNESLRKTNEYRRGKRRWVCRKGDGAGGNAYCYSTTNPNKGITDHRGNAKDEKPRKKYKRKIDHRRIFFTAAQNATPLHFGFWRAVQAMLKDIDAEVAVIPLRYKNPTSVFSDSQRNAEHWLRDLAEQEAAEDGVTKEYYYQRCRETGYSPDELWARCLDQRSAKYLYEQRKKFNDNLVVIGDVKIQPTRVDPLQGLEGLSRGESAIIGHTKLRMKTIATPQSKMPKVFTTTGACTVPNYTDSTAGKKGEFHHILGGVLVEIESRTKFHLHHINARDDGSFIFKRRAYYPDGTVEDAPRDKAIIFGDAHYRFADPKVVEATFGPGKLVETHDPEVLVWHDLLDTYFGNPHHRDDPFIKKAKEQSGFDNAAREVFETIDWMRELGEDRTNVIVASNHDDMFKRWIVREDWKKLYGDNMEFYLETALHMARSARMTEIGAEVDDPFVYWLKKRIEPDEDILPLNPDQEYEIGDIALNYHGDKGPGGARGTVKNLSEIGTKVITGHGHAPEIYHGHMRVGTMTRLTAEYVTGPNNWLNAHASIDAFNKRHLHICIDGKFYMED